MKALLIKSTDANGDARNTLHHTEGNYDPLNWHYNSDTHTVTVYENGEVKLIVAGVNMVEYKADWYPPEPTTASPEVQPGFQNKADANGMF